MKAYALRVYVGPTLVPIMAQKFREADIPVEVEGTAHIHCVVSFNYPNRAEPGEDARAEFFTRLIRHYDHTFCLTPGDVVVLRELDEMAHRKALLKAVYGFEADDESLKAAYEDDPPASHDVDETGRSKRNGTNP